MSKSEIVVERATGALNLIIALVSYMFGVLVFLPMAKSVGMPIFEIVTASLILIEVSYFLAKGLPFIDTLVVYAVRALSDWWVKRKDLDESESSKTYRSMYFLVTMALPFLAWLFFSPLLKGINPAFNGLILILVILFTLCIFLINDEIRPHKRSLTQDEI